MAIIAIMAAMSTTSCLSNHPLVWLRAAGNWKNLPPTRIPDIQCFKICRAVAILLHPWAGSRVHGVHGLRTIQKPEIRACLVSGAYHAGKVRYITSME